MNDADVVKELLKEELRDSLKSRVSVKEKLVDADMLGCCVSVGVTLSVCDILRAEKDLSLLTVTDDEQSFDWVMLGLSVSVAEGSLEADTVKDDSLLSDSLCCWVGV